MILETCRRGIHVNRIVNRVSRNLRGDKHHEEWHVCRFCKREVKHRVTRVIGQEDVLWRSSR